MKIIFVSESNQKEILRESTLAKDLVHGNIARILGIEEKHFTTEELEREV